MREGSDAQAFRLALIENMHRKALSHVEMVDALDELADMVQASGLRRTAAELRIDPGWLSKQLSMRRDRIIFPALEEGKLTFTQANELLSAPAAARRPLLDRLYRERPTFDVLRTWVQTARAEHRRSQQHVADLAAGAESSSVDEENRFEAVREKLVNLGDPRTPDERNTLGQILELVQCLLAQHEPAGPLGELTMYHLGEAVTDSPGNDPTQERVSVSVSVSPRRRRTLARVV